MEFTCSKAPTRSTTSGTRSATSSSTSNPPDGSRRGRRSGAKATDATTMIDKADAILALFTPEQPELAVIEIAALLRRPRSSVYRILSRMAQVGFLDQDPATGRYRIGIRLGGL